MFRIRIALLSLLIAHTITAQPRQCTATGDLQVVPFHSATFPAPRNLRILLPPGYRLAANQQRRYPVLYLNDGQNLFDVCTTLYGGDEWRVDETVDELIAQGKLQPLIVVGIDNGGRRLRPKEYLPYVDDSLSPPEPNTQGKRYPKFLLDEVVPYVERNYRALPGARHRVLGGSSYGAGISLYTVIERPGSFDGLLLESPSIYADDYHLLKDAASARVWPRRVYLGTGTVQDPLADVRKLQDLFQKAGLGPSRLKITIREGAAHSEKWWADRLPAALRFLFEGPM